MVVVEDRPLVAARHEVGGQGRLPDALGEPGTARPSPEPGGQLVAHPAQLGDAVGLGQRGQDRLGPAAAQDLDLTALGQGGQALDRLRLLDDHPLEERARVVEADANAGMPLEGGQHRLVGRPERLLDDPPEVAHGLMVVEDEGERDARRHGIRSPSDCGPEPARCRSIRAGRHTTAGSAPAPPQPRSAPSAPQDQRPAAHAHRHARLGPGRGLLPDLPGPLRALRASPDARAARALGRAADRPRLQGRRPLRHRGATAGAARAGRHGALPDAGLRLRLQPSVPHLRLPGRRPPARRRRGPARAGRWRPRP